MGVDPRAGRRWEIETWCVSSRKVGLYAVRPKRVRPKLSNASTAPGVSMFNQTKRWTLRLANALGGANRSLSHRADVTLSQRWKPRLGPRIVDRCRSFEARSATVQVLVSEGTLLGSCGCHA